MEPRNENDQPGLPPFGRLLRMADRAPVEPEERLRLYHYSIFLVIGAPLMSVFAVYNILFGPPLLGWMIAVSIAGLVGAWLVMVRRGRGRALYRVNFLFFAGVTVAGAHYGGVGGSYGLWAYSYPLIAFFLLGLREGLAWAVVMGVGVVAAQSAPGGYAYPAGFIVRFGASYAMVVAATAAYEHLRSQGRSIMADRQAALEREVEVRRAAEAEKEGLITELRGALDEVRTLQGLIPICSGCHQIRDDAGFWQQLECYLEDHSDARFSHGLCPACARRLYPDFVDDAGAGEAADRPRTEGP